MKKNKKEVQLCEQKVILHGADARRENVLTYVSDELDQLIGGLDLHASVTDYLCCHYESHKTCRGFMQSL